MIRTWIASLVLLGLGATAVAAHTAKETTKVLSFARVNVPPKWRIAGLRVEIHGARVAGFPRVPADWGVSLELEGSNKAIVVGMSQHGSGGLNASQDLDRLIEVAASNWEKVRVVGVIYITQDFEQVEPMKFDSFSVQFLDP